MRQSAQILPGAGRHMRFLEKLRPAALLLLRCGLALTFIYHGYPKLFGGTAKFVAAFHNIGLPSYFVYIAGAIELLGGVLLVLGLASLLLATTGAGPFSLDHVISRSRRK